MFKRQKAQLQVETLLNEGDRERVGEWWNLAVSRIESGQGDTTWLANNFMVPMALGFAANSRKRIPPLAYSLITRAGYALRMYVGRFATPEPLDVSMIDRDAIATLASLPRDPDTGLLTSDVDEELLAPIAVLVSDTAEQSPRFAAIISVEPTFWNACVAIASYQLQKNLEHSSMIRRARDLDADTVESFLRYGFVLRSLDEALGLDAEGDQQPNA